MRPHPQSKKRYWRDKRKHDRYYNSIQWMVSAMLELFPSVSWKNEIPMFGGPHENTGVIWGNIAEESPMQYDYDGKTLTMSQDIRVAVEAIPMREIYAADIDEYVYTADVKETAPGGHDYKQFMRGLNAEPAYMNAYRGYYAETLAEREQYLKEYIASIAPPINKTVRITELETGKQLYP